MIPKLTNVWIRLAFACCVWNKKLRFSINVLSLKHFPYVFIVLHHNNIFGSCINSHVFLFSNKVVYWTTKQKANKVKRFNWKDWTIEFQLAHSDSCILKNPLSPFSSKAFTLNDELLKWNKYALLQRYNSIQAEYSLYIHST